MKKRKRDSKPLQREKLSQSIAEITNFERYIYR